MLERLPGASKTESLGLVMISLGAKRLGGDGRKGKGARHVLPGAAALGGARSPKARLGWN